MLLTAEPSEPSVWVLSVFKTEPPYIHQSGFELTAASDSDSKVPSHFFFLFKYELTDALEETSTLVSLYYLEKHNHLS